MSSRRVFCNDENQPKIGEIFSKKIRTEQVEKNQEEQVDKHPLSYFDKFIAQRKTVTEQNQNVEYECEKPQCKAILAENQKNITKLKDASILIAQLRTQISDLAGKFEKNAQKRKLANEEVNKQIIPVCSTPLQN